MSQGGSGPLPVPTRDQLCKVKTSGMQGLTVSTQYGNVPWFDPYITSPELSASDRQSIYAAKKAAGDTHFLVSLSWNYVETGVKFGSLNRAPVGFDGTKDWNRFLSILDEIISAGFYVSLHLAGDGLSNPDFSYNDPQGWTYGFQWLMGKIVEISGKIGSARSPYIIWCPGFDGCVPGWAGPENDWHRTNEWLVHARQVLGPQAVLAIYLSSGYWAWSGENDDYATPDGQNVDVTFYEGPVPFGPRMGPYPGQDHGSPWDQVWQISKRLLRSAYRRPSDQPSGDDPGIIAGDFNTPRGKMYRIFIEISTYLWVRGAISQADVEWERQYLRDIGWGEFTG